MFGRAGMLVPCLVFAFLAGCGQESGEPAADAGGVAVIDLDAVAVKLGRDGTMANAIKERADSLNEQLKQYQVTLRGQYDQKKHEFETTPAETQEEQERQKTELQVIDQQLGTHLNQTRAKAQQNLNVGRLRLIQQFRAEVKPVAQAVASELGLSTVVTKNETVVFAFSSAVDITDQVAERMGRVAANRATAPAAQTARQASSAEPQRR